jgi:hypothetical protein
MKNYIKQLVIITSLSSLVACAGAPSDADGGSPGRGDCIHQPSIRGYTVLDEQNLIIDASLRKSYHVTLQRRAFGLKSTWAIGFDSPTSRVCGKFSEVVFNDNMMGIEKIRIASIRELIPEEEEALLIQFGIREPEIEHTPSPGQVEGADVEELDPDEGE